MLKSREISHLINILHVFAGFMMVVVWLVPDHYFPWGTFYQEYLAFFSLLLLFLAEFNSVKRVSSFAAVFFLAIVWICVQLIWGVYLFKVDAWTALVYLVAAFVAYQIGLSTPNKNSLVLGLAAVMLFAGLINGLIGLCQWLGFTSSWIINSTLVFGNLAQPNNYATLLFLSFCSVVYFFLNRQFSPLTFCLVSVFLLWGIVLSESRTPLLQFAFLFGWIVWLGRSEINTGNSRYYWVLGATGVLYLLYFTFPFVDAFTFGIEPSSTRLVEGRYTNRLQIWCDAIVALGNSPWLGYGWGQVSVVQFSNILPDSAQVEYVERSHNILLDLMIWNGPLMGSIIIGYLGLWLYRYLVRCSSVYSIFLFSCIGGLIVHSMLEFPHEYAFFLLPIALMFGLIEKDIEIKTWISPIPKYVYGTLVLVPSLILMVVIWREYRVIEEDHRAMRAQNFGLRLDVDLTKSASAIILDGQREFIRFARTKASKDMTKEQLAWMKKVVYRYPIEVAIYRYSIALALNGFQEEAEVELGKINTLYGDARYQYWSRCWEESVRNGAEI